MKNKMRLLGLAVLAMAVMTLASCQKDEMISGDGIHFTTTLKMAGGGTKALTEAGVKTFAAGDQVAVIYKNTSGTTVKAVSAELTAGDITSGGKVASFNVELTDPDKTLAVTYIYPASMANSDGTVNYDALKIQDGTLTSLASSLDVCTYSGAWDGSSLPSNVTMDNQLAICKFTIDDWTSSVTKLTVKNGSDIYTVNTSSLSEIWVAMKPVITGDISVYAAQGKALYKKTVSGKTLAAGNLYPVSVATELIPGALSGLFTVNDGGDLVYFSQGNLQASTSDSWSTWTFSFMEHQYSTVETNADPYCTANYGDKTVVSLFGWGTSGYNHRTYFWQPYNTKNGSFNSGSASSYYNAYANVNYDLNQAGQDGRADWGYNAISNGGNTENSGWRTMTSDEWSYLLNNHTKGWASVNGVNGLVIRPNGVSTAVESTYTAEAWAVEEAAGAVFLPAAGTRVGNVDTENKSYVVAVGSNAYYWTATHYNNGTLSAYRTKIGQYSTEVTNNASPSCGNAVRLVRGI